MQNYYTPMPEVSQDGWPFKLRRLSRSILSRQPSHAQKAPPRLHERPLLVETSELELVDILSSTINTPSANLNARPVHRRQNTLEDPRRFNVLDTKGHQKKNSSSSVFGSLKRRISDRSPRHSPNASLATRELPGSFGVIRERTSVELVSNNLPEELITRPATPKPKSRSRESSPIRAAKSIRRKLSRKFSRIGKGKKVENDLDSNAAYPLDIKMVIPDPVAHHPAVASSSTSSSTTSTTSKPLRRNFSRKDLRRPNTSTSTSTSMSISAASTRGIPPLSIRNQNEAKRMLSSSSLRSGVHISTDIPITEAQEIISPPPTYSASMDFASKEIEHEQAEVDVSEQSVLAENIATSSTPSESQSQPQTRTRALSNAPRPSMAPTARSSIDIYSTNISTQYTHDTVAPLIIRKVAQNKNTPPPTRFKSLKRSLSDFKSRPLPPSHSQSQDTSLESLSTPASLRPKPKRMSTSSSSKSYYTLGSAEAAVPGVSRSLTVAKAKRASLISSQRSSYISYQSQLSPHAPASARNSISTIRSVPHSPEFLPIKAASTTNPLRNFSRPGTARSQTSISAPEKKTSRATPRKARKPDFLKMFEVPNLMMDCGGYDEFSYSEYTYTEYPPYSTGQMIRELSAHAQKSERNSDGASSSSSAEFEKFIEEAKREAGGRDAVVRSNMGVKRRGVVV